MKLPTNAELARWALPDGPTAELPSLTEVLRERAAAARAALNARQELAEARREAVRAMVDAREAAKSLHDRIARLAGRLAPECEFCRESFGREVRHIPHGFGWQDDLGLVCEQCYRRDAQEGEPDWSELEPCSSSDAVGTEVLS